MGSTVDQKTGGSKPPRNYNFWAFNFSKFAATCVLTWQLESAHPCIPTSFSEIPEAHEKPSSLKAFLTCHTLSLYGLASGRKNNKANFLGSGSAEGGTCGQPPPAVFVLFGDDGEWGSSLMKENYGQQVTKAQETGQILIKWVNFPPMAKDMHMRIRRPQPNS